MSENQSNEHSNSIPSISQSTSSALLSTQSISLLYVLSDPCRELLEGLGLRVSQLTYLFIREEYQGNSGSLHHIHGLLHFDTSEALD